MNIVEKLKNKNLHISTMESCTGGSLANYITNISDSSLVFSFGAVTYSNSFKEKFNVDKSLIDKYSVYSIEVAKSMSYNISIYSNSDIGVGITGLLGKYDKFNQSEKIILYILQFIQRNIINIMIKL